MPSAAPRLRPILMIGLGSVVGPILRGMIRFGKKSHIIYTFIPKYWHCQIMIIDWRGKFGRMSSRVN